jgi:uncharacterized protein (TIGR02996 family)
MCARLWAHPQVLALLLAAKESPHDDAPRLVLADWLEDHGEPDRAEFVRCQLRLAPGSPRLGLAERQALRQRSAHLLRGDGGCWLGPLWDCRLSQGCWHRGLLSAGLPRAIDPGPIAEALAWADALVWEASGHRGFERLARLAELSTPNHLFIDLRRPVREDRLIEHLAFACGPPCLRTLSIEWPLGLVRKGGEPFACSPNVNCGFLARLLGEVPLCRRLTHLASNPDWSAEQAAFIRSVGVEPVHAVGRLWMHGLPASHFRRHAP